MHPLLVIAQARLPPSPGTDWAVVAFTALGGAVGGFLLRAWYDWLMERRRVGDEFRAAALLVSDELRANIVTLEIALQTTEDPEPLASQAYDAYQMIMARHLPPTARDAVRAAYIHARVPRAFQVRDPAGKRVASTPVVQEALDKSRLARGLLAPYIPHGAAEI